MPEGIGLFEGLEAGVFEGMGAGAFEGLGAGVFEGLGASVFEGLGAGVEILGAGPDPGQATGVHWSPVKNKVALCVLGMV